ncbi:MAG: 50S ribosomal protein L13 [Chlamydiota bacterium]
MKDKTKFVSKEEAIKERKWYLFDAKGKTLGRFASEIAKVLRGKHKPNFTPNQDTGDGVIVINVEEILVTGNKKAQKNYYRHSGHVGQLKEIPYAVMLQKKPEYILEHAVKGMLPKTKLGRAQIKKMHVFKGGEHNMQAQQPIKVNI